MSRASARRLPRVSVIVPATRPDLLPRALAGIAAQTYRGDLEVIVVHDGGAALDVGSWPFALRSIGLTPRQGPSRVRNAGMAWAAGDVLAFCDDDDLWLPDHLQATVAEAARQGGLAFTDALLVHVSEGWQRRFGFRFSPDLLRQTNPIILSTAVLARGALGRVGGFDQEFDRYEAWDWFLRMAQAAVPIVRVPRVTVEYRYSGRSATADADAMAEAFARFCRKHGLEDLPLANFAVMAQDPRWSALREGG